MMSCIASSMFAPGTTIVSRRDWNASSIIASGQGKVTPSVSANVKAAPSISVA
jgi:hypothetical protein